MDMNGEGEETIVLDDSLDAFRELRRALYTYAIRTHDLSTLTLPTVLNGHIIQATGLVSFKALG